MSSCHCAVGTCAMPSRIHRGACLQCGLDAEPHHYHLEGLPQLSAYCDCDKHKQKPSPHSQLVFCLPSMFRLVFVSTTRYSTARGYTSFRRPEVITRSWTRISADEIALSVPRLFSCRSPVYSRKAHQHSCRVETACQSFRFSFFGTTDVI